MNLAEDSDVQGLTSRLSASSCKAVELARMACEPRDIPSLNLNACDLGSGYVPKLDSAKNEHINWSLMRMRDERCSLAARIDMESIVLLPHLLFKKWNSYETRNSCRRLASRHLLFRDTRCLRILGSSGVQGIRFPTTRLTMQKACRLVAG